MNKKYIVSILVVLSLVLTGMANAASTIGTNMSTTGTFTQTVGSATAALFQNAAGTVTTLSVDTTNVRVGVGAAPSTTFEVQGTASASYFFTQNTIQVAGVPGATASVAYSRFGTGTTGHSLAAADDILVSGLVEFDDNAFFDAKVGIGGTGPSTTLEVQGTASASYFFTQNTIQVAGVPGATASVAYSRFGTGTTSHSLADADDILVSGLVEFNDNAFFDAKVGIGGATNTIFEVQGTASASYFFTQNTIQVGGTTAASASYNRFGTSTTNHSNYISTTNDLLVSGDLEVKGTISFKYASISQNFSAGTAATATSSFTFDSGSTTQGACIVIKDNDGSGYTYLTVSNGVATFDTTSCMLP